MIQRLLKLRGTSSAATPPGQGNKNTPKDVLDSAVTVQERRTKVHVPVEKTLVLPSSWNPPRTPRSTTAKLSVIPEKGESSEIKQEEEDEELKEGEPAHSTTATPHEEAGKKEGSEEEEKAARRITLRLLGVGPRLYAVAGLINVPVYALSLYAEPTEAQAHLLPTLPSSFDPSSPPPSSYYNTLVSSSTTSSSASWPRALYLTFCRSVGTKRVLDAFTPYPRLAATVLPSVEASFEEAFGGAGIQAGDSVGFVWLEGEGLLTVINGRIVSLMEDQELIPNIFSVWLGETPVSVEAKIRLASQAGWLKGEVDGGKEGRVLAGIEDEVKAEPREEEVGHIVSA